MKPFLRGRYKTPMEACLLPRRAVNLGHQNNANPRMEAPIIDDGSNSQRDYQVFRQEIMWSMISRSSGASECA